MIYLNIFIHLKLKKMCNFFFYKLIGKFFETKEVSIINDVTNFFSRVY
jgi:hypothetical protein